MRKVKLDATWYLQIAICCYQLTAFGSLTTCSRLVIIKPEQATRTHAHIDLMTSRWKPCGLLTASSRGHKRLDTNCRVYLLDSSLSSSCTKPVGFFKLHWRLPKSDVMQFNICRLAASCWNNQLYTKNVLPNNSPQACWQLAGDFLSSSRSKRSEHILIPRAWWQQGLM